MFIVQSLEATKSLLEETLAALEPRFRTVSSEDEMLSLFSPDSRRASKDSSLEDLADDDYFSENSDLLGRSSGGGGGGITEPGVTVTTSV